MLLCTPGGWLRGAIPYSVRGESAHSIAVTATAVDGNPEVPRRFRAVAVEDFELSGEIAMRP